MSLIMSLILVLFIALAISCNTAEPPDNEQIKLIVEEVSCTEAWLKLISEKVNLPVDVIIKSDNNYVRNITLNSTDQIIYIDSLMPNENYVFQVVSGSPLFISSNRINVQTLDTTRHNLNFQEFEFNILSSSSTIEDIEIIDDHNILAVGEFYPIETGDKKYSLLEWNGMKWEFLRLLTKRLNTNDSILISPTGIFSFSTNNIWLAAGSIFHWDRKKVTPYWVSNFPGNQNPLLNPGQFIRKIWGASETDIYGCGEKGALVHFDGKTWKRIETNTEYNFTEIVGIKNKHTEKLEIYLLAVDIFSNDSRVYKLTNNSEIEIINLNLGYLYSFWTNNGINFYVSSEKFYFNNTEAWQEIKLNTSRPILNMEGASLNDLYVVGADQFFAHYNGITWFTYKKSHGANLYYNAIAVRKNKTVIGGISNGSVEIIVGTK